MRSAKSVMDPNPMILPETLTLREVARLLGDKGMRAVLLKSSSGKLKGIYTEKDLAYALSKEINVNIPISELMTPSPVYVSPDESLEVCAEKMQSVGCHHMPVILNGKIVGMVEILKVQQSIAAQLKEHVAKLEAAHEKIVRRDDYLGIVAHDLRSPLGVIKICSDMIELLRQNKSLGYQEEELNMRIRFNADRALQLINDLLDLGRLNTGVKLDKKPISIPEYLAAYIENLRFSAREKQVELVGEIDQKITAHIDKDRFGAIITNLVQNAIKFTRSNSKVILRSEFFPHGKDGHGEWKLSISDEGPGIPKDKINVLFGKYQQLDSESKKLGFGLGLSIAQQFTKLHGGRIEAHSEEGKGATFVVTVPNALIAV